MTQRSDWTDEELLRVIDMVEREKISTSAAAKRLGVSRSAVCGQIKRIRDAEAIWADTAEKPENKNGGMPPGWGLKRFERTRQCG